MCTPQRRSLCFHFNQFQDQNTRQDSLYRHISVSSWVDNLVKCCKPSCKMMDHKHSDSESINHYHHLALAIRATNILRAYESRIAVISVSHIVRLVQNHELNCRMLIQNKNSSLKCYIDLLSLYSAINHSSPSQSEGTQSLNDLHFKSWPTFHPDSPAVDDLWVWQPSVQECYLSLMQPSVNIATADQIARC